MCGSERLTFRKLQESDLAEALELSMDEATMKYIMGKALSLEEATSRFHSQLEITKQSADFGFFVTQRKDNLAYIGHAKFVHYADSEYEVGYVLKQQQWGKGYASEMLNWMKAHAQSVLSKPYTLIGIVEPENIASVKVLEKGGFTFSHSTEIRGKLISILKFDL